MQDVTSKCGRIALYKSPDTLPTETTCRQLVFPNDPLLIASVADVLSFLGLEGIWEESSGVLDFEMQAVFTAMLNDWESCVAEKELVEETIEITHRVTNNTVGGATTSGSWQSLPFGSIDRDDTGGASLSGNLLVLPSGRYDCHVSHVFFHASGNNAKIRLRHDDENTTEYFVSQQERLSAQGSVSPVLVTAVEIGVLSDTLEMEYRVTNSQASNGLGTPMNVSEDEIYGKWTLTRRRLVEV